TSSATPVFESEEAALAAAEAAYAAFVETLDAIGMDGWQDPSPLREVAIEPALSAETETAEFLASRGYQQSGLSSFDSLAIQQFEPTGTLTAYVCLDVSAVQILDQAGTLVTPTDRQDRVPLEIDIEVREGRPLVARVEPWSGP